MVLSDSAALTELDATLLSPGTLPGLWEKEPLTLEAISRYFSGTHFISVDKGGYTENQVIPSASSEAIRTAVIGAVKLGRIWLVNGTIGLLGEDVPVGFVNEQACLFSPPPLLAATELLPTALAAAWTGNDTTAFLLHASLSSKSGKTVPWSLVQKALDEGFRLGLIERTLDSGAWPCDLGGAGAVKIHLRSDAPRVTEPDPRSYGAKVASADLETHQLQELADCVDELRQATAGQKLKLRVVIEVGEAGKVPPETIAAVNGVLGKVKAGWTVQ